MLWRREEAEYDTEEGENYEAAAVNRFRRSWYDLHLLASFWRVPETTPPVVTPVVTPEDMEASGWVGADKTAVEAKEG